jgi:hypothetical protein
MEQSNCKIEITDDVVDVAWDDGRSTVPRIGTCVFLCGMASALAYGSMFQHGKKSGLLVFILNHPALLKEHPELLYLNIVAIVLVLACSVSIFIVGIRSLFPFGSHLNCNRSTFTISKIAFWSLGNRWKVQSAPPSEISQARYGVVQHGRRFDVYGIRADVCGKSWKVFAGIDASEAKRILQGLSRMGVHVLLGEEPID